MDIQNNTNCIHTARGSDDLLPCEDALRLLHDVGYRSVDISLTHYKRPDFILRRDDWQQSIERLRLLADMLGMRFGQCHFPFAETHLPSFSCGGESELFDMCMERACVAAGILGVSVGVQHPRNYPDINSESALCLERNRAYYDRYVSLAWDGHVRTAFENMMSPQAVGYSRRYCDHYEQLIELIDSYESEAVGACLDTGHANQNNLELSRAVGTLGKRLLALHINDNHKGRGDEHLLPYMGDIDWEKFIRALVISGYSGDLTYEVGPISKNSPRGPFQKAALRAIFENHRCFFDMYKRIQAVITGKTEGGE